MQKEQGNREGITQLYWRQRAWVRVTLSLVFLLCVVIIIAAGVGAVKIAPVRTLAVFLQKLPLLRAIPLPEPTATETTIIWAVRLPRIILALLVGAALAGSGTALQGLFRNPLVDPYIIGISAGAGLGASLCFVLPGQFQAVMPLFAFAGAVTATLLVYFLSWDGGKLNPLRLLLAGVAVGAFLSAILSFIMLWRQQDTHAILTWLMGGVSGRSWREVRLAWPYIVLGLAFLSFWVRELNLFVLGDETATNLGVDVEKVKRFLLLGAALATAAAVSVSGTIGFVGLVIPHLVRLVVGPDHRILMPTSILVGAIFLIIADTLARTLLAPIELPVGIITAFVGAPFFLYLLQREFKR